MLLLFSLSLSLSLSHTPQLITKYWIFSLSEVPRQSSGNLHMETGKTFACENMSAR